MKSALFISFEGIDGCGKSAHIQLLKDWLQEKGEEPLLLREPGGSPAGEKIRELLLSKSDIDLSSRTELLLFLAARAQLCETVIRPALNSGRLLICDRFSDSTLAYQGFGRGLETEEIARLDRFATGGLKPDLTFLLDLPVSRARERVNHRNEEKNRMDEESRSFMERVRAGFDSIAAAEPERVFKIDSSGDKTLVQAAIREIVGRYIQ